MQEMTVVSYSINHSRLIINPEVLQYIVFSFFTFPQLSIFTVFTICKYHAVGSTRLQSHRKSHKNNKEVTGGLSI